MILFGIVNQDEEYPVDVSELIQTFGFSVPNVEGGYHRELMQTFGFAIPNDGKMFFREHLMTFGFSEPAGALLLGSGLLSLNDDSLTLE
jgi:hypothetical protein